MSNGGGGTMKRDRITVVLLVFVTCLFGVVSCSNGHQEITPETRYVMLERPAPIPPGVMRYCWEEPMVQFEPNGPGLNSEGTWYHPSYIAVRKVKQGRWRPCREMPSEIKGETRNER